MLAREDMAASEIAEALGISAVTVYRYRDKYNIPIKEGSRGRKPEPRESGESINEKVEFLAKAGATVSDVAMKLEMPPSIVRAIARKYEISIQGLT
jgi:transposase-like protein